MARKKKQASTGQLDSVIGQGPDNAYVNFFNNQQQQKSQKAAQQKQQQTQEQNQPKKQSFLSKLVKGAENVGESTAKTVAQPFVDTGKQVAKQVKFLGGAPSTPEQRQNLIQNQQKTQQEVKNNKVSSQTQSLLKQSSATGRAQAEKMISKGAKETDVQGFLKKDVQALSNQTKKGVADAAQIVSLGIGGGETAKVATGAKSLIEPALKNAAAGAVGSAGSEVAQNPRATPKQIAKAAGTGAALGVAITGAGKVVGKGASKAIDDIVSKTGVGSKKAAKDLITNTKTQQALDNARPTNDLEKLASKQNTKSAKTAVAELPSEAELPQPKAPEPPMQTEIPQRPVEQIAEDIKQNNEHIRTITGKSPHDLVANAKEKPISKEVQPYIDTHQELQKEYVQATTPTKIPTQNTSPELQSIREAQPSPQTNQGTSKIGKSINTKAIEQGLTKTYGDLAQYSKITIKDQAKKAADVVNGDPEQLRRIVNGQEKLPEGLKSTALVTAVEQHALKTKDVDLLRDLARSPHVSESSRSAQELRLAAEREPDSASVRIKQVIDARRKAVGSKIGSVDRNVTKTAKGIKDYVKTPSRQEWGDFINEITCK